METVGEFGFNIAPRRMDRADYEVRFKFTGVKTVQVLICADGGWVQGVDELQPEEVEEIHRRLGLVVERMKKKGYLG